MVIIRIDPGLHQGRRLARRIDGSVDDVDDAFLLHDATAV